MSFILKFESYALFGLSISLVGKEYLLKCNPLVVLQEPDGHNYLLYRIGFALSFSC